jgi:hypothetical protein
MPTQTRKKTEQTKGRHVFLEIYSDSFTCFSLTQNVTQNSNDIQHKVQFINGVVY